MALNYKLRKPISRDFIDFDGLEDFLVSFVKAYALESFITVDFKEMTMTDVLHIKLIH